MIDWGVAHHVGLAAAGGDGEPAAPPVDLEALRADAIARVADATGLDPGDAVPPFEWVGRRTWIAANIATMRATLEPALADAPHPPGPLRGLASGVLGTELGGLLGVLGRRVMGQYDVRLLAPVDAPVAPRLLLVAPNLVGAARQLDVDLADLVTWVGVHEATHAVQFAGAPWLRTHLGGLAQELLGTLRDAPDLGALLAGGLDGLVARIREQGIAGLMLTEERSEALNRLQGTMALVEGHAEWTMDAAGAELVDDIATLRAALDRRRAERPAIYALFDRLLGLELKLRQYREGRVFCDALVAEAGRDALTAAWAVPERVPTLPELHDVTAWRARTGV